MFNSNIVKSGLKHFFIKEVQIYQLNFTVKHSV